jgi:pyrroline-5-carboxylate reductase
MTDLNGPLLLVGAGKMGSALIAGLIAKGLDAKRVIVQDPAPPAEAKALLDSHGIAAEASLSRLPSPPAVLLLAVKPQIMDDVLPPLSGAVGPETLVLSIAAGRTLASLERHLPPATAVVRAMPNTPASVGRGITALVANAHVTSVQKALAESLMAAVGETAWLGDESLMDAVTAVSGSGPAYVFLLAECLTEAGLVAGLDRPLAERLARATISGSGSMLAASPLPAATLRENVTSPGGTTAAALAVLMGDKGLQKIVTYAVCAAARRSRELAG